MDERDQQRQPIDARPEGTGRLRAGVAVAHASAERLRGAGDRARAGGGRARDRIEDAAWLLREKVVWPVEDGLDGLGPRGRVGVFGGGGIALAGVIAAILVAGGGSGSDGGTTEAFVAVTPSAPVTKVAPAPKPKKKVATKPGGPTLHGAAPVFAPATGAKAGVGDGKALGGSGKHGGPSGGLSAEHGSGGRSAGEEAVPPGGNDAAADETPASTAKIASTPAATASAAAQADKLATGSSAGAGAGADSNERTETAETFSSPPAPKAAKRVARRFAEAFVVYETGGIDGKVRGSFGATSTKQLSKSLLHRPPRQPANVKVPRAKVVTVVAGPSKGQVYEVSVSLLRVGVTSELRLQMERGPGNKWQVTNVLG